MSEFKLNSFVNWRFHQILPASSKSQRPQGINSLLTPAVTHLIVEFWDIKNMFPLTIAFSICQQQPIDTILLSCFCVSLCTLLEGVNFFKDREYKRTACFKRRERKRAVSSFPLTSLPHRNWGVHLHLLSTFLSLESRESSQ